jgi:hypothetical protein
MPKEFDQEELASSVISVVRSVFKSKCRADFYEEPVAVDKDIIEYSGKMRVFPMEKFNGPVFIGVVNYYLSEKDLKDDYPVGTFVLYIKEDIVENIFKACGRPVKDAESQETVLEVIGELSQALAQDLENEFQEQGYVPLVLSSPLKYKNTVPEGVFFDYRLFKKQEITFSFWHKPCVVVEACMGAVPQTGGR